jgi:hypothetical protein
LVDWKAYLAGLTALDRARAEGLAERYGQEAARKRVRYHPVSSLDELEEALSKDSRRVTTQVPGLYESIDVNTTPVGWYIENDLNRESDGTRIVRTDVIGPNGAKGFFERGYNPVYHRIEMRNAFLRHNGMNDGLPPWVAGVGNPMVPTRGTPTVQSFTLYQLKLLGVPAGRTRWRRLLYRLGLRTGPFVAPGVVSSIKMSTIQNLEAIMHLHWLRRRYPTTDLSALVVHTASVEYAETTAVQCGYRLLEIKYVTAGEAEAEIGRLLDHFEAGNPARRSENDALLSRFYSDRLTVMKCNFDIELSVEPM